MRAFVITTFALALAIVPAAASAQATGSTAQQPPASGSTAQQPPASGSTAQQPPASGQAAPAQAAPAPAAPKIPFTTPAGMLLVTIKGDKTAVFEEMVTKLKAGFAKSQDETLKKQATGLKFYKATEPAPGGNALYVVLLDPAVPAAEYDLFQMLAKTMTPEEQRAPETAEMWKRFADAFPSGMSKLSLTQLGG